MVPLGNRVRCISSNPYIGAAGSSRKIRTTLATPAVIRNSGMQKIYIASARLGDNSTELVLVEDGETESVHSTARAISRSLSVTVVTLGSHELECPHPVAADPFRGFLDGVRVLEPE